MKIYILAFVITSVFLNLSCKRCKTRHEPEFIENELSWVNIDNLNPRYQIKYKEGSAWKTDTVVASHVYSGITYSSYTEGDCEDNVRFPTANIKYCILFPNQSGCYETLVMIKNEKVFSVLITNLHEVLYNDPRTDTATILGVMYNDVYRGNMDGNGDLFFSKKIWPHLYVNKKLFFRKHNSLKYDYVLFT